MDDIPAKKSSRWAIHFAYLCMIALTWWVASSIAEMRRFEIEASLREVSSLLRIYVQNRSETDKWIEAERVYATRWHLRDSIETESGRMDTFAGEGMRLIFNLSKNGEIAFDVVFNNYEQ